MTKKSLQAALTYIDSWLEVNFDNSEMVGMQVAVRHNDDLIYSKSFGYANAEKGTQLSNQHVFHVASHSKTFTANAIMQLFEAKKLNLDDTISHHLTWFTSKSDERIADVTIRQLLNHTAGLIRDGIDSNFWQLQREFPDEAELRDYISDAKLIYDSDTQFKYSNYGFGYLGLVIEKVADVSYGDYISEHILQPLSLESTTSDFSESMKNIATGYSLKLFKKDRKPLPHIAAKALASATGFISNAEDLSKFFSTQQIGNNILIKDSSKRVMQHGTWDTRDEDGYYGLGITQYSKTNHGHGGGYPGFLTNTQINNEHNIVISVLSNAQGTYPALLVSRIHNIINAFIQHEDDYKNSDIIKKIQPFTGRFYNRWGVIDIVAIGTKLIQTYPVGWRNFHNSIDLEQVDGNRLVIQRADGYNSTGEFIDYKFDNDGNIDTLTYAGASLYTLEDARSKDLL